MRTYKVYIVKVNNQEVVYVGHTSRTIERRLSEHKGNALKELNNLTIHLVSEFNTKKEARDLEDELQSFYGFQTDTEKKRISAAIGSRKRWDNTSLEERSIVNSQSAFKRWENKNTQERSIIIKKGHDTRKLKKQ